jgi:hypothetical protein
MNINNSFEQKMNHFTKHLDNSRYIIEISKFCGYSEFVLVYKEQSLIDLYKIVSYHFQCDDIKGLYLSDNKTLRIPITQKINIRDFIIKNQENIRPIYPLPYPVVYKFYIDDGHICPH